jgi:hypothetical protein
MPYEREFSLISAGTAAVLAMRSHSVLKPRATHYKDRVIFQISLSY